MIHFDAGEPDFEPPKKVVEATVRALREGKGRYTESGGIPEAKKAISEYLEKKIATIVSPDQSAHHLRRKTGTVLRLRNATKDTQCWNNFA